MNQHIALARRFTPLRPTFATWKLNEDAIEATRTDIDAATLDEALSVATPPMMPASIVPKGGFPAFVILETNEAADEGHARQKLHSYVVKVRRDWRAIGPFGSSAMAAIPYAVHIGSIAMDAFAPRRPFDPRHDNPANGRQPGEPRLIEVRS